MSHVDYFSAYRSGVRKVATIVPTAVEVYIQGFLKRAEVPALGRSTVPFTVSPRQPWARSFNDLSAYPGRPVPGENRAGRTTTTYTPPANSAPGFRRLRALTGKETNAEIEAYIKALAEQDAGDKGFYRINFTPPRVTENSRELSQDEGDRLLGPARPSIQTRVGEVTQVPGGTVGAKPLAAGDVLGPPVETQYGIRRETLTPIQQTAKKYPQLGIEGSPENVAYVAAYNAEQKATGKAPDPMALAERLAAAPKLRATPPELRPDSLVPVARPTDTPEAPVAPVAPGEPPALPALEEPPAAPVVPQLPGEPPQPTVGLAPGVQGRLAAKSKRDNPNAAPIANSSQPQAPQLGATPLKPSSTKPEPISSAKNKQFKDSHGTNFDPDSRVDKQKLTSLPPLSTKPEPISSAKNKQFKDSHGTNFDPDSRVDKQKLRKLPTLAAFNTTSPLNDVGA